MSKEQPQPSGPETTTESETEAFFGSTAVGAKGDPLKTEQTGKATDAGDPVKGDESTSATGPEKVTTPEKSADADKHLYAGKYETTEALEQGALEQLAHISKLQNEAKAREQEVAQLKAQLAHTQKPPEPSKETPKPFDPSVDPRFAKMRKVIEENFGDDAPVVLDGLMVLTEGAKQPGDEITPLRKELQQLREETEVLRTQRLLAELRQTYPDIDDPEIQKHIDELNVQLTKRANDPVFSMELAYHYARSQTLSERIEKGVKERLLRMSKAEKEKLIAGSLVAGTTTGGGSSEAGEPTERDLQEHYFGKDVHRKPR